jgi:hypothetical protein
MTGRPGFGHTWIIFTEHRKGRNISWKGPNAYFHRERIKYFHNATLRPLYKAQLNVNKLNKHDNFKFYNNEINVHSCFQ